jgi:hypothetical protein
MIVGYLNFGEMEHVSLNNHFTNQINPVKVAVSLTFKNRASYI